MNDKIGRANKKGQNRAIKICALFFVLSPIFYPLSFSFASTGASFLKLGVGARALGMGSAYTAVVDDVTALHWNPAGLGGLKKREFSATHAELFADTRYDFVGYAQPISGIGSKGIRDKTNKFTFGVGAVYLSQGDIEGRSVDRGRTRDFTASDLAMTLGLARSNVAIPFTESKLPFSLGANVKLLQSKISGFSSTGFAFDIGFVSHSMSIQSRSFKYAFAVQNLGPQMKFVSEGFNLPLSFVVGGGYQLAKSLLVSADVRHEPYDSQTTFSIGTEFSPFSLLSLRTGYLTKSGQGNRGLGISQSRSSFQNQFASFSGLGLGVGLKLGPSTIDYSFAPTGELGNTQRVSLSIQF